MSENRRVKYTKMVLNESFLKFLSEKPLSRITVKEICEDADVNRSTYYVHFTDPYDQLKKMEADIMANMAIYVDNITENELDDEKKQFEIIKSLLEYIKSKQHIFQILLSKGGEYDLQRDILSFFAKRLFKANSYGNKEEKVLHYKYIYASTGAFGMIYHWVIDDNEMSINELAKMITVFTSNIRLQTKNNRKNTGE